MFGYLFPKLAEGRETIAEAAGQGFASSDQHVYLVALLGLAVFYGLDRLATESRRRKRKAVEEDSTAAGVFWIHISSFADYKSSSATCWCTDPPLASSPSRWPCTSSSTTTHCAKIRRQPTPASGGG